MEVAGALPSQLKIRWLSSVVLFCFVSVVTSFLIAQSGASRREPLPLEQSRPWVTSPHGDTSHRFTSGEPYVGHAEKYSSQLLPRAQPPPLFTPHIRKVEIFPKQPLSTNWRYSSPRSRRCHAFLAATMRCKGGLGRQTEPALRPLSPPEAWHFREHLGRQDIHTLAPSMSWWGIRNHRSGIFCFLCVKTECRSREGREAAVGRPERKIPFVKIHF